MAKAFHEASPYNSLEFSEDKCRALFESYLVGDKRSLVIILATSSKNESSHVDESPHGMIIGLADSLPFSNDRVAAELAWWVDEDKRGSRDSFLLFKAYEDWALRVGAKIKQMAMLDDVTNLAAFYEKQGYRPAERSYIKDVN